MKQLHQIAIKFVTYLILNKRKRNNKQPPIDPPNRCPYRDAWLNMTTVYKLNPDVRFILFIATEDQP